MLFIDSFFKNFQPFYSASRSIFSVFTPRALIFHFDFSPTWAKSLCQVCDIKPLDHLVMQINTAWHYKGNFVWPQNDTTKRKYLTKVIWQKTYSMWCAILHMHITFAFFFFFLRKIWNSFALTVSHLKLNRPEWVLVAHLNNMHYFSETSDTSTLLALPKALE